MRRVTDAQESGPRPLGQPVYRNREEGNILPIAQFFHAVAKEWTEPNYFLPKCRKTFFMHRVGAAFGNHVCALPIFLAIQHYEYFSGFDMPKGLLWVARVVT